eukprot:TRINITY_DN8121_c0_g2_i1.p1 TRINITY_DN8121_c0_g2~~TRINITY_DN8121_c0_g2_i1.p1  ORF type:complete len:278 (+),score=74.76 TRINITY_DN8121_c0_g2_i1:45-878(+)
MSDLNGSWEDADAVAEDELYEAQEQDGAWGSFAAAGDRSEILHHERAHEANANEEDGDEDEDEYEDEEEYEDDGDYEDEEEHDNVLLPRAFVVEGDDESSQDERSSHDANEGNPLRRFSKRPPSDGMEYLRLVRKEARTIPSVMVSKVDPFVFRVHQTQYIPTTSTVRSNHAHPVDDALLPTLEWRQMMLLEFRNVRVNMEKMLASEIKPTPEAKIPSTRNSNAWHQLCFGIPEPKEPMSYWPSMQEQNITMPMISLLSQLDQVFLPSRVMNIVLSF